MQNTTKTTKIPRVAFHLDSSNVSSNNGGSHVYLRVRIEGKYIYFPTNVYVAPEHWDKQAKKVRHVKGHRNSNLKEEQLDTLIANMRSAIGDIARAGRPITERSLKNRWGLESRETFRDFADHILQTRKKHLGKSTLDNYKLALDKVDAFDPGVKLGSISPEWVQEFTEWLRSEGNVDGKPLKHNSMVLYLGQIRTLMKIAKKSGLIQHDPFEDLDERPKMKKSKREFLTEAEIQHLHNMYVRGDLLRKESYQSVHPHVLRPEVYHNLLQAFLVSVYTGLRKSDVRRVDQYLVGDHIYMTMKKTGMSIRIKIIDRLREIMHSENQILNTRMMADNDVSPGLKIVLQIAGINRPLCFHSARHTFATTLLAKGVDLKTVSQLLGHKKIATTDIYTHITDKQREEGISRLDTLGESSEENPAEKIKALLAQHPELRQNEELQALFQRKGASIIHRVS